MEEQKTLSNCKDSRGRFTKGNPGGPGNPLFLRQHAYMDALRKAITPSDVRKVLKAMIAKALKGDVSAAKLVLDRALGIQKAMAEEVSVSDRENGVVVNIIRDDSNKKVS